MKSGEVAPSFVGASGLAPSCKRNRAASVLSWRAASDSSVSPCSVSGKGSLSRSRSSGRAVRKGPAPMPLETAESTCACGESALPPSFDANA